MTPLQEALCQALWAVSKGEAVDPADLEYLDESGLLEKQDPGARPMLSPKGMELLAKLGALKVAAKAKGRRDTASGPDGSTPPTLEG
ncbi:hypothetical protein [Roseateles sp.]|uniref:hypothetical protein n=1 Tax=Roseateles sp. TaxID=1971397 RepID=UPI003BAC9E10